MVSLLAVLFADWLCVGTPNFYSVGRMQSRIAGEVPDGSTEAQVLAWAKRNRFEVYPGGKEMVVYVRDTRSNIACGYDTVMFFRFDHAHRLVEHHVEEHATCL